MALVKNCDVDRFGKATLRIEDLRTIDFYCIEERLASVAILLPHCRMFLCAERRVMVDTSLGIVARHAVAGSEDVEELLDLLTGSKDDWLLGADKTLRVDDVRG